MELFLNTLSALFLLLGSLLGLTGAIGILRLPDFYTRIHAAGITDTLTAFLILTGVALLADSWLVVAKLAMVFFFLAFTSPTASHALAKAARQSGLEPVLAGRRDPPSA